MVSGFILLWPIRYIDCVVTVVTNDRCNRCSDSKMSGNRKIHHRVKIYYVLPSISFVYPVDYQRVY
jgi:hypothetical protein